MVLCFISDYRFQTKSHAAQVSTGTRRENRGRDKGPRKASRADRARQAWAGINLRVWGVETVAANLWAWPLALALVPVLVTMTFATARAHALFAKPPGHSHRA